MSESKPRTTDVQKLQRAIFDGLEDVKGQDIVVFNTEHLSPLFERVIIASGTSNRQTKALAMSVSEAVRDAGFPKPRMEGEDNGEWIIVDCGAAVAHVMQPNIRQYYHLEEIWGGKAVHLKSAVPAAPPAVSKTAAKTAAKAAAAGTPAAKRPAAKAPAKAPVKSPAKSAAPAAPPSKAGAATRKTPARKTTAAGDAAPAKVKTLVVGKPPAKKAASAKSVAPRAPRARKTTG
ncbi:MAG: ribosome silencing factor [Burkholderiaceae bacterium]|nr:ribosome silencing factor [Burkholderiaceae bacterium]